MSNDEARRVLRELDDPDSTERPERFDQAVVAHRFTDLVQRLEAGFGCRCWSEQWPSIQDAAFWGNVRVPAAATNTGADIAIRVSNFGALAVYDLENVGAYDEGERAILLDPLDRERVESALEVSEHFIVPDAPLDEGYNGSDGRADRRGSNQWPRTWFARYFDYI